MSGRRINIMGMAMAAIVTADKAAFRLLMKFHRETACGQPYHWAECDALVDAFGYEDLEQWRERREELDSSPVA